MMKNISQRMTKLSAYLRQLHPLLLIPLFVAVILVFTIVFSVLLELFRIPDIEFNEQTLFDEGIIMQIVLAVIIAPLVETLIFQKWAYRLLSKIKYLRSNVCWIIIISGIIFGSLHYYSLHYMIVATGVGFFLMYAYILRIDKRPYWTVVAIHALSNLAVLGLSSLFDV